VDHALTSTNRPRKRVWRKSPRVQIPPLPHLEEAPGSSNRAPLRRSRPWPTGADPRGPHPCAGPCAAGPDPLGQDRGTPGVPGSRTRAVPGWRAEPFRAGTFPWTSHGSMPYGRGAVRPRGRDAIRLRVRGSPGAARSPGLPHTRMGSPLPAENGGGGAIGGTTASPDGKDPQVHAAGSGEACGEDPAVWALRASWTVADSAGAHLHRAPREHLPDPAKALDQRAIGP
jgi:hypothetical protein